MNLTQLTVVVLAATFNAVLAFVVYLRNRKSASNNAFAVSATLMSVWLVLNFMCDQPAFYGYALTLNRLAAASGLLMGMALVYFGLVFPSTRAQIGRAWMWVLGGGVLITGLTVLTPAVVQGVELESWGTNVVQGPLFPLFAAYPAGILIGLGVELVRKYRHATGRDKSQLAYLFVGTGLFALISIAFGVVAPLLTGGNQLAWLNTFATPVFIGFIAYAIVRHRVMDVRLVVLRGAAYAVLVLCVAAVFVAAAILVRADIAARVGWDSDLLFIVAGLATALGFQPLRRGLERMTDRVFYQRAYNPNKLLRELGAVTTRTLDPDELAAQLGAGLRDGMRLDFAATAYCQAENIECASTSEDFTTADARLLTEALEDNTRIVFADDPGTDAAIAALMTRRATRVLVPLEVDGALSGALFLGAKRSGGMYSSEDWRFLSVLRAEASIAIKNAQLFGEKTQRVRELMALNDLAYSLGASVDLEALLNGALEQAVSVTGADRGSIMLLDDEDGTLHIEAGRGIPREIVETARVPVGTGVAGWVAATREPLILVDDTDPRFHGELKRDEIISAIAAPIVRKDKVIGVLNVARTSCAELFTAENLHVVTSFAGQLAVAIENARLYENLEETFLGTIEALAATVDAKDPYTFGHSKEVTRYAVAIAEALGMPEEEIRDVRVAATLHDIGKVAVDGAILQKPGKLTAEERELMNRHPATGADILSSLEFLKDTVPLILFHHERYGGGGYPSGISGETIPLGARIISVADSYNAMVSDRPYRKALSVESAVKELKDCSATQFDPAVVDAFLDVLAQESLVGPVRLARSEPAGSEVRHLRAVNAR